MCAKRRDEPKMLSPQQVGMLWQKRSAMERLCRKRMYLLLLEYVDEGSWSNMQIVIMEVTGMPLFLKVWQAQLIIPPLAQVEFQALYACTVEWFQQAAFLVNDCLVYSVAVNTQSSEYEGIVVLQIFREQVIVSRPHCVYIGDQVQPQSDKV